MEVMVQGEHYIIKFPYDTSLVEFCRSLQRARYNPQNQHWTAVRNLPNALDLRNAGHFDDGEMLARMDARAGTSQGVHDWEFIRVPYEYQQKFVEWGKERPRALLNGDPGVGKTLMSLMWLGAHRVDPADVLIVCPASLIPNWHKHVLAETGKEAIMVTGLPAHRRKAMLKRGIHIVNYEYCAGREGLREEITAMGKTTVILDESHMLKNSQSERSKVFHRFGRVLQRVLLLTGTPVSQGAQDYYSQFRVIDEKLLGASFSSFKARYCEQRQVPGAPFGVTQIIGYRNLDELNRLIAPYIYTIRKKDCLDLPEKIYDVVTVELAPDQRKRYNQMERDMILEMKESKEPIVVQNILPKLLKLSEITQGWIKATDGEHNDVIRFNDNPKRDALETILESKEPTIIVCRFLEDIEIVKGVCKSLDLSFCTVQGSVEKNDRAKFVDAFQAGQYDVLIGQIATMGVGFDMYRASRMIFYSNDYNYVNREQAEDRIHRIGQVGQHCQYIDIVARDTIDEQIVTALKKKGSVAETLLDERLKLGNI